MTALPGDRCLYCTGTASKHDTGCKAAPLTVDKAQLMGQRQTSAQLVMMNLRTELGISAMQKIELAVVVAAGTASEAQSEEFEKLALAGEYTLEKLGLR